MGTLSSELASASSAASLERAARLRRRQHPERRRRATCASTLRWDVLFVLEHDELRRASDVEHYRLARQLGRTLITLDRDYLDDRRFPPDEGAGVMVCPAPDERWLRRLLRRVGSHDVPRRKARSHAAARRAQGPMGHRRRRPAAG